MVISVGSAKVILKEQIVNLMGQFRYLALITSKFRGEYSWSIDCSVIVMCICVINSGEPPVDEVEIMRGQVKLLHNQLLFERHKCDLHAIRNRRLIGKTFKAVQHQEELLATVSVLSGVNLIKLLQV